MAILPPSQQGIHISKPMNEGLPREADTCHNSPPLAFSLNQCPLPHPSTRVCLPRGFWGYWNFVFISQLSYAFYLHVRHIALPLDHAHFVRSEEKNRSPSFPQDPVLKTSTIYMTSHATSVLWWYDIVKSNISARYEDILLRIRPYSKQNGTAETTDSELKEGSLLHVRKFQWSFLAGSQGTAAKLRL